MEDKVKLLEQKKAEVEALEIEISSAKYAAVNLELDKIANVLKSGRYFKINGTFIDVASIGVHHKTEKMQCHGHVEIFHNEIFSIRANENDIDFGVYSRNDSYTISVYENDLSDIEAVTPIAEADFMQAKKFVFEALKLLIRAAKL